MDNYRKIEKIGEGAHGVVFKVESLRVANDSFWATIFNKEEKGYNVRASGTKRKMNHDVKIGGLPSRTLAMKKIRMRKKTEGLSIEAIREIKMLQELDHPNVMKVIDIFNHEQNINIVMPYMELDLDVMIKTDSVSFSPGDVKMYMKMILQGIDYCHRNWVLHRDIKPANLLLGSDNVLKLADFGLAKIYGSPDRELSHQACTLWYRAPELLFGARSYGPGADMWSVGCIFGELMSRKAMFKGANELNQLQIIFSFLGTPRESDWPGLTSLPQYTKFAECSGLSFKERYRAASDHAVDLITRLLTYDPQKRISAKEALSHSYFTSYPPPTSVDKLPRLRGKSAASGEHLSDKTSDASSRS